MDVLIPGLDLEVHRLRPEPGHPCIANAGDLQVDEDAERQGGEQQSTVSEDQETLRLRTF